MALTNDNYVSTLALTDRINAGVAFTIAANENLAVDNTGMSQSALYYQLNDIVTNWNLLMTKIEADGATTTTYTPNNAFTTLASQGHGLSDKGMYQKDLIDCLSGMVTKFNAVLDLLDADGGVTLTDYNTVVDAAGTGSALDLDATVDGSYGIDQDKLVTFLQDFVTKFNTLLANCDADND